MVGTHREFKTPPDDTTVWRYMDLLKFVDLISTRDLFFSRLDTLEDKYEGYAHCDDLTTRYLRYNKYVNCWSIDDYESNALWGIYGKGSSGSVAIKSTVGNVRQALNSCSYEIYIGEVNYENGTDTIPKSKNFYSHVVNKRKYYAYEKELRLCVSSDDNSNPSPSCPHDKEIFCPDLNDKFMKIRIDLGALIQEVYVSPSSEKWAIDAVKFVCKDVIDGSLINRSALVC